MNRIYQLAVALVLAPPAIHAADYPALRAAFLQRDAQTLSAITACDYASSLQQSSGWLGDAPALEASTLRANNGDSETELNLMLPSPFGAGARRTQAQAQRSARCAQAEATRIARSGALRLQLAQMQRTQALLQLAGEEQQLLQQLSAQMQRRVSAGENSRADALALQLETARSANELRRLQREAQQEQNLLQAATGMPPPEWAQLNLHETDISAASETPALTPALQSLRAHVEAAAAEKALSASSAKDWEWGLRWREENLGASDSGTQWQGLQLRLPLGRTRAQKQQQADAQQQWLNAQAQWQQAQQQAQWQAPFLQQQHQQLHQQDPEQQLASAAELLRLRLQALLAGELEWNRWNEYLQPARQAQREAIELQYAHQQAYVAWADAAGVLP